jgi:hypothetical protein
VRRLGSSKQGEHKVVLKDKHDKVLKVIRAYIPISYTLSKAGSVSIIPLNKRGGFLGLCWQFCSLYGIALVHVPVATFEAVVLCMPSIDNHTPSLRACIVIITIRDGS